ncbi:hypothetical protein ACFLYA_00655 [Candidatus Dependentiae bacterium]
MKKKNKTLIFVLHDGIGNSVFEGQVLAPIEKKIKNNSLEKAIFISFEKKLINYKKFKSKNIFFIFLRKYPFLGELSLLPSIWALRKILKQYDNYQIIARGPIAGWLCAKTIDFKMCTHFTIQARGLLAEEYAYAHKDKKNMIKKLVHAIRSWQFKNLEKKIYSIASKLPKTNIEAVSCAMKAHLHKNFKAKISNITVATDDIPDKIEKNKVLQWRAEIRKDLHIAHNAHVYCYNGSVKPWQCPQMVVDFFSSKIKHNNKSFLLVLTQDTQQFEAIMQKANIPKHNYVIKRVAHHNIYNYLAAADYGIIFRKNNIVNWVARPTKILEYNAAGLEIIHNNTVGFLKNQAYKS